MTLTNDHSRAERRVLSALALYFENGGTHHDAHNLVREAAAAESQTVRLVPEVAYLTDRPAPNDVYRRRFS